MAATLSLDTITSSGTDIEIPTGKVLKIADAGALKINDVAITTGAHVTAVSAVNPLTITSGNVTGKSSYAVSYDASSGTSTVMVVNLPAPADFSTAVISVVSSTAHGAGNSIEIRNSAGTEVYTLYHKGDHCEFISDGTNTLRTGNEFTTIHSEIAATGNLAMASGTTADVFAGLTASNYSVDINIGAGWNSTTHDFIAPHAGLYRFGGHGCGSTGHYITMWMIKKNGVSVTNVATATANQYGDLNSVEFPISLAASDSIEFWATNHNAAHHVQGAALATDPRAFADAWLLRRY